MATGEEDAISRPSGIFPLERLSRADRDSLQQLGEMLWPERHALAERWSTRLIVAVPDSFKSEGFSLAALNSLHEMILETVLLNLRRDDIETLYEVYYEFNLRLIQTALKSGGDTRLSLRSLYMSASVLLRLIADHLAGKTEEAMLAFANLNIHLMMLVGCAYSDARAQDLRAEYDALERRVQDRTAELTLANETLRREIAERERIEQSLMREKYVYDTTIDSLPGVFYLFEEGGRFRRWNKNFESFTGYSHDEVALMHPLDFFDAEDRERVARRIAEVLATGQSTVEADFIAKSGKRRPFLFTGHRITLRDERCVIGMGLDISGRKLIERDLQLRTQELARSNSELEQFAYAASHDLQEPLRAVASYAQLLDRKYRERLDADADRFIEHITSAVKRMQQLIRDLFAYSRVGLGSEAPNQVDCDEILAQVLADLETPIAESGAAITVEDMPTVTAHPLELRQLFQNLIGNAIKFRGERAPAVHVSCARSVDGHVFAVRDNGIGIEPEYAERIFVIFQRLHSRRLYEGTGVGLALCKRVVERHGGRIWVGPTTGGGSTFYFTLPTKP